MDTTQLKAMLNQLEETAYDPANSTTEYDAGYDAGMMNVIDKVRALLEESE